PCFCHILLRHPLRATLFPYTTLFRSVVIPLSEERRNGATGVVEQPTRASEAQIRVPREWRTLPPEDTGVYQQVGRRRRRDQWPRPRSICASRQRSTQSGLSWHCLVQSEY